MSQLREQANEIVEASKEGFVDLLMSEGLTIREPEEGGCRSHTWETSPHMEYDIPDPDPRNPMVAYRCRDCPAEKHKATWGARWSVPRDTGGPITGKNGVVESMLKKLGL